MSKAVKLITKIITGKVRLNYVNIFQPRAVAEGEEEKYSLQILIEKSDMELVDKISSAVEEAKRVGAELWGGAVPKNLKSPLRDGDLEDLSEEYAGHYYINMSAKSRPVAVDRKVKEIKDPSQIYSGCYGKVSFNLYAYNHEKGGELSQGIGCGILNIQKLEEGDALGRPRPEDDFEVLEEAEDILS